jgi:hypothetical protein
MYIENPHPNTKMHLDVDFPTFLLHQAFIGE